MNEPNDRPASAVVPVQAAVLAERRAKLVSRALREAAFLQVGQLRPELILQFFERVESNDTSAVCQMLLENPALVRSCRSDTGMQALHTAAMAGNLELAMLLLDAGADPNARTPADGYRIWASCTPLHFAAGNGHVEVARKLLASGADIEARSADHLALGWGSMEPRKGHGRLRECEMCHGETPLHAASSYGMDGMVAFLLDRGAAIEAAESRGRSALAFAVTIGRGWEQGLSGEKVVKLLLDRGADPNHTWGRSCPLEYAILSDNEGMVRYLLARGADPHWCAGENKTLLLFAISWADVGVVRALLEAGLDPNACNSNGETALHLACTCYDFVEEPERRLQCGDPGTVEPLDLSDEVPELLRGPQETLAEYSQRLDRAGYTLAGVRGDSVLLCRQDFVGIGTVKLLVDRGVGVNVVDDEGETPLHRAARSGIRATAGLLVANGADPKRKNRKGQTAADIADECHLQALARWLHTITAPLSSLGGEPRL
jgi:ankyrin repeat protein